MKTVKQMLFAGLLILITMSVAAAEEKMSHGSPQGPTVVYSPQYPITVENREYEMHTFIMDFQPGAGMPDHIHGGPVLVVVLSGEIVLMEKDSKRTMKTGDSWTEAAGNVHSVVNSGATICRVAVNMLLPKGAEATTIIKK